MSSLRGGFRSTVRGATGQASGGARRGWLSTALIIALLAAVVYFVLRRYGVLN